MLKPKRYFAGIAKCHFATIYSGCHFEEIEKYKDGLRTANLALITQVPLIYTDSPHFDSHLQSSFQVVVCLSLLFVMPRVPDIRKLTRSSVIFAIIGGLKAIAHYF